YTPFILNVGAHATTYTYNFGQDSSFAGTKTAQGNQDENDKGDFYYEPPSGFLALCTDNLSDPSIADPTAHFNTVLWSGVDAANSITGVGFQPDLLWFKARNNSSNHRFQDVIRGATSALYSNNAAAEGTNNTNLNSFDTDGFSMNQSPQSGGMGNYASDTYVGWNWKAGGAPTADNSAGAGATPTAGSVKIDGSNLGSALAGNIAATRLSANTTSGFSIVKYTGTGISGDNIAHGLSEAPTLVITKGMDESGSWQVGSNFLQSGAWTNYLTLETNSAVGSAIQAWNNTAPSSTIVTLGTGASANESGDDFVAYCFHNIEGYSKVGSYEGNNNVDGAFVYCGFKVSMVLIKNIDSAGNDWLIFDDKRDTYNLVNQTLFPNASDDEATASTGYDFVSNGFKARSTAANKNQAYTYLYYAVAESPFKYSNAR
ncbi:MAG: hypothetical protein QF704_11855, partial [Anaerolineales bacterium]|nr:hypothetical protein [Anaerolineales bacterium]